MMSNFLILTFFAVLGIGNHQSDGGVVTEFQPEFSKTMENITVPLGRDATFTCMVRSLGGYRVGWVRADSKAIQAIHTHKITHNPRVGVSHTDHSYWHLHIKGVTEEDRGAYMCQINTDPMIYQISYLEVVIPPDFISDETSPGDVMAAEGSSVKLTCNARGHPTPSIVWKREHNLNITLRNPNGVKNQVTVVEGTTLTLNKISRADMGIYFCLSSNGVAPSIMKRIMVTVHFNAVIHIPHQLIGAHVSEKVSLECNVESFPRNIHFWVKDSDGTMIITGDRYEVHEIVNKSMFEVKMILVIRKFQKSDAGAYRCVAKGSLGDVESVIKLHDMNIGGEDTETKNNQSPGNAFVDEDDEFDEDLGSFGGETKNPKLSNSYYSNSNRPSPNTGKDPEYGSNGKGSISGSNFNGKTNSNKKSQPAHHLNNKSQRQHGSNYQTVVVPVLRGESTGGGATETVVPNSAPNPRNLTLTYYLPFLCMFIFLSKFFAVSIDTLK